MAEGCEDGCFIEQGVCGAVLMEGYRGDGRKQYSK